MNHEKYNQILREYLELRTKKMKKSWLSSKNAIARLLPSDKKSKAAYEDLACSDIESMCIDIFPWVQTIKEKYELSHNDLNDLLTSLKIHTSRLYSRSSYLSVGVVIFGAFFLISNVLPKFFKLGIVFIIAIFSIFILYERLSILERRSSIEELIQILENDQIKNTDDISV